jgi:hypothetical protein
MLRLGGNQANIRDPISLPAGFLWRLIGHCNFISTLDFGDALFASTATLAGKQTAQRRDRKSER